MFNGTVILIHDLPGVFGDNIYNATVNGALWTLPIEFACYIGCAILLFIRFIDKRKIVLTIPAIAIGEYAIYYIGRTIPLARAMILPTIMFLAGMFFWIYKESIELSRIYALLALAVLVITFVMGVGRIGMAVFFSICCSGVVL